jgi:hypothetical protein
MHVCCLAGTPLTVQLDWVPSVTFAGVLVAKEKGWYEQAGLDVSIQQINVEAMTTSVGAVLNGTNMIGIADGPRAPQRARRPQAREGLCHHVPGVAPLHHGASPGPDSFFPGPGWAQGGAAFV